MSHIAETTTTVQDADRTAAPAASAPQFGGTGRRKAVDQLMRGLAWFAGLLAIVPLVWILGTVVAKGAPSLFSTQPDYTRICTTSSTNPDRYHEPYVRVAESQCAAGGQGKYRYLHGGQYPAVGQMIDTLSQSGSMNPTVLTPKAVVAMPGSDKSGTVRLFSMNWWKQDLSNTPDQNPGGGALHAIVGTLWIGLLTSIFAVPLGVLGAIYLVEYARGHRAAKVVSFMVDILTGIPSIVAALFVFAVWVTTLGFSRSTFATSLALVLLMLPTVLRSTEEMLKLVPDGLREASYALGVPRWRTITSVVLPTARTGILTGIVLGIARVMGETAPLLILLNYARTRNLNPLSNTMGSLPTMISNAAALPENYPGAHRGWGAAFTLILIVMGLNLVARAIGRSGVGTERKGRGRKGTTAPAAAPAAVASPTVAYAAVADDIPDAAATDHQVPDATSTATSTPGDPAAAGTTPDAAPRRAEAPRRGDSTIRPSDDKDAR